MSSEDFEGFPKPGTTLEGRIAQLFRIMGYRVTRNIFLEGHEIDVCAENEDGKKIIVECKEYYTSLINRDLILIFSTKVRDIKPYQAWFVTISDFEASALELCKRYGIYPVNGYELEELEEKTTRGPIKLGPIPPENRLQRILERHRNSLRKKKRKIKELKKITDEIDKLRQTSFSLPPFLFPMSPSDLERKTMTLKELEKIPKISTERISQIITNFSSLTPKIRGFKVIKKTRINLSVILSPLFFILGLIILFLQATQNIQISYIGTIGWGFIFIGIIFVIFYQKIRWHYSRIYLRPCTDVKYTEKGLEIPAVNSIIEHAEDIDSRKLFNIPALLADKTILGYSEDYIIDLKNWNIIGTKIKTSKEICENTDFNETIVPIQYLNIYRDKKNELMLRINALYVLSETFLQEKIN